MVYLLSETTNTRVPLLPIVVIHDSSNPDESFRDMFCALIVLLLLHWAMQ